MSRKPYTPLGTLYLVRINGDRGDSLLAKVVRNAPAVVVEVIQPHPVYEGARLTPTQYTVERRESV